MTLSEVFGRSENGTTELPKCSGSGLNENDYSMKDRKDMKRIRKSVLCMMALLMGGVVSVSAQKAERKHVREGNDLYKTEMDSKVYSEYDEQFQVFAWLALILLVIDVLTLDRKNRIYRRIKLF